MIDNENLILANDQNNQINKDDLNMKRLQHNLIMMGFDISMINKIINIFNIKTEDEAIDYLIKNENGMWKHPFIPKEEDVKEEEEFKNILISQPQNVMNNVFSKLKKTASTDTTKDKSDIKINNDDDKDDFLMKINEDICEICGEEKQLHLIKEFNNSKINLFDDEIEEIKYLDEIVNNINDNINNDNNNQNNEIIKEEEKLDEEEENSNPNECQICMGDLENPIEIEKCKHKFCQDCFHSYLVNLIKNNQIDEIPCPKNKCKNKNLREIFFSQFLSEQEYFKYRQFRAQNEIARDAKKIFCPLCDSYADIGEGNPELFDSNNPDYVKTTLKCKKGHDFCSCGRPLHEGDCYHDEKEFKDFVDSEQIKKCPKCGFLIKKNKGCNHMTCGNPVCKYEFCWLCMQEAVPNHFDYGPCAGKQFWDPDSFSYKLQLNHPRLYILYSIFMGFINVILFLICGIAVPGLGLIGLFYMLFFEEDVLQGFKTNIKYIAFFSYVCMGFAYQSLIYIAWGIIIGFIGLIIVGLIIQIVLTLLKIIFECIFCGCSNNNLNSQPQNNENILPDDINV